MRRPLLLEFLQIGRSAPCKLEYEISLFKISFDEGSRKTGSAVRRSVSACGPEACHNGGSGRKVVSN
jgi:hypothetical protein